jgi:mannose-6-phosphate isomerase-like protein (cupin superfamily)
VLQEVEMRAKTIWTLLLTGVAATAMAATVSAEDGLAGLKTKAELEQLATRLRSGELTGSQMLFRGEGRYSIDTSYFHEKRKAEPQVHVETDEIFLVLSGAAHVTLGGELTDKFLEDGQKNELRGTGIKGGTVRQVAPGDVVSIPRGTAHHVDPRGGYIIYMVIKIPGKK